MIRRLFRRLADAFLRARSGLRDAGAVLPPPGDPIGAMVAQRRKALWHPPMALPGRPWGLALSGGGIRSATFSLGLLKALAGHCQLLRFDLLSTVSGGGYAGAAFGKLCSDAANAREVRGVEAAFADLNRRLFGWWLRANGRYLIPGGLRESLFAGALYLRNLLGIHIELAIAAMLAGSALAAFNLVSWGLADAMVDLQDLEGLPGWARLVFALPSPAVFLLVPAVFAVIWCNAYWCVRERHAVPLNVFWLAVWGTVFWTGLEAGPELQTLWGGPAWLTPALMGLAACWGIAIAWTLGATFRGLAPAAQRNWLTALLASALRIALLIALLALLDRVGWWLASATRQDRLELGAALLLAATVLRAVLPQLFANGPQRTPVVREAMKRLAGLAGLALAFLLAAFWIGVLYSAVLLPVFTPDGLNFTRGWIWLLAVGGSLAFLAVAAGPNLSFLNVSSLHMFYRARLARSYLGAANPTRLGGDPLGPVPHASPLVPVDRVDARDDIPQQAYAPHAAGGPVHIVNTCLNQTRDPGQFIINQDSKGLLLSVAPGGWVRGSHMDGWQQARESNLSLAAWTAISGAAFAPGLGHMTRPGLAALAMFSGIRLGYWWDRHAAGVREEADRPGLPLLRKTLYILRECFGAFSVHSSRNWFLSDGGHFENTGAYALLQRECELIVLADCGADPDYRFADLERLVRRARIDLQAGLSFMKPRNTGDPRLRGAFGSLNDLASSESQACLALARIRYASGEEGRLVVVKPNVSTKLPIDLINFKAAHPDFPQQPTTDQFFDEAQWESYFQLGNVIGRELDAWLVQAVTGDIDALFEDDDGRLSAEQAKAAAQPAGQGAQPAAAQVAGGVLRAASKRLHERVAGFGVVGTSVGIGAIVTAGVAAWQSLDGRQSQEAAQAKEQAETVKTLTDGWGALGDPAKPEAVAKLAADLQRHAGLFCADTAVKFVQNPQLPTMILADAKKACKERAPAAPSCRTLLSGAETAKCLREPPPPEDCRPHYWGRDYSGERKGQENCLQQARRAELNPSMRVEAWLLKAADFSRYLLAYAGGPGIPRPGLPASSPSGTANAPRPPASAVAGTAAPAANACHGVWVYPHIRAEGERTAAMAVLGKWQGIGAEIPRPENVVATASKEQKIAPGVFPVTTLIHYAPFRRNCAEELRRLAGPGAAQWKIEQRTAPGGKQPRYIEVWFGQDALPPAQAR